MKNFNVMEILWKIWFLRGVVCFHEKLIYKVDKGGLGKKEGIDFFLTAICLPHGKIWIILKETVSLNRC